MLNNFKGEALVNNLEAIVADDTVKEDCVTRFIVKIENSKA